MMTRCREYRETALYSHQVDGDQSGFGDIRRLTLKKSQDYGGVGEKREV